MRLTTQHQSHPLRLAVMMMRTGIPRHLLPEEEDLLETIPATRMMGRMISILVLLDLKILPKERRLTIRTIQAFNRGIPMSRHRRLRATRLHKGRATSRQMLYHPHLPYRLLRSSRRRQGHKTGKSIIQKQHLPRTTCELRLLHYP